MKKLKKASIRIFLSLSILYLILLIPDPKDTGNIIQSSKKSFEWNSDALWQSLEKTFKAAKSDSPVTLSSSIAVLHSILNEKFTLLQTKNITATDNDLQIIESAFFSLAPLVAAKQDSIPAFIDFYNQFRGYIKLQSQQWNMNDPASKNTIYSLLYGMRQAIEEVLLQADSKQFPSTMLVTAEKSNTPSTTIFGIEVHSGDMLVSRGGAEVSALISRGNDYPGNFSHVALIYIEEKTNKPYLIEAHIEKGVAVSSVDDYVKDKKLRFMVMRLRADHPAMKKDSMLPQKAAKQMYELALSKHIPYDFKMNYKDSSALFCSEVASYGYRKNGIQLWKASSTISSQGVVNWLHDFGVENFITQMPSDLEYDPQLAVVAEWRDPATLYKDHIDNAVMDALLEKANAGESIGYTIWQLPLVRIVKGYCWIKNLFGKEGIIPEGMSATQALKNQTFVAMHISTKQKVEIDAENFVRQNGYKPPYWQLVKFAEAAVSEK
ncbi:YiiX/YebB-like N1pC/P60 family cysteine hydrolase [Ferruginibacter sp. SUN002]|uniref:YiiX/YebB-like N1pC/P60 family cysteine hydrolase n=1 Tax=Ferruginibacter sp. SUN002 TaxID=2937789 RepID=UPI003D3665B6